MKITLDIKPLSYNQYYRSTRSGKRVKTGAGLAYEEELEYLLSNYSDELLNFGKELDLHKNIVRTEIKIYNPDYFIKDGSRINKNSPDVDNCIKVLQDKLFKVIDKDDVQARDTRIYDVPSNGWKISIEMFIVSIPDFCPIYL